MEPGHLVIAAPSSDEDQYSMAICHPGNTGTAGDWKNPGDLEHMRETLKDFDAPMRRVLDMVDSSVVWKVVEGDSHLFPPGSAKAGVLLLSVMPLTA
jgi:salicylate hydroxylase